MLPLFEWFNTQPEPEPQTAQEPDDKLNDIPYVESLECMPLARSDGVDFVKAYSPKAESIQDDGCSKIVDSANHLDCLNAFKIKYVINDGMKRIVRCGERKMDGNEIALKTVISDFDSALITKIEFELLKACSHPNIIRALEFVNVAVQHVLILESFDGMQLDRAVRMTSPGWLPESLARNLGMALIEGTRYLHKQGIIHGDLCPQCILVSHDFQKLKIVDLHAAATRHMIKKYGTSLPAVALKKKFQLHAAPEVILGAVPSELSDVWQIGLCLYLMLSGHLPQRRDEWLPIRESVLVDATQHISLKQIRCQTISQPCTDLLQACLRIDRHQRPTSTELINDEWIRENDPPQKSARTGIVGNPLLQGLEQLSIGTENLLQRNGQRRKNHLIQPVQSEPALRPLKKNISHRSAHSTERKSSTPQASVKSAKLEGEPSSVVEILRPIGVYGTVILVNHVERTYKVRLADGCIRTVKAEDIMILPGRPSSHSASEDSS